MGCAFGCFEASVKTCDDIIIRANFPASYPLYWLINKSGSNNLHQRLTSTTVTGDLVIPKADLPAGYLIKGGVYKIQVRSGADYLQPISFVFGEGQYTCILTSLKNIETSDVDLSETNVIQFTDTIAIPDPTFTGADFIKITDQDFSNSTDFNLPALVGKQLLVFWNDIPKFLDEGTEYILTSTGIRIIVAGFDATANTYKFIIYYK